MAASLKRLVATRLVQILLVALTYYLLGRLGQLMSIPGTNVTPVWPPSGLAQAALLLLGYHVWPGIGIGAFFANIWPVLGSGSPLLLPAVSALIIGIGSTLQAVLGASLLKRVAGVSNPLGRVRDIFVFVLFSGLLSCVVAPTFGVTGLCLTGLLPWSQYQQVWWTWWLGDTAGVLIVAPLLLSWRDWLTLRVEPRRGAEAVALFLLTLLVGQSAFGAGSPVEYMFIPLLLWAAFRFGPTGALTISLMASGMAILGTINGVGSFARADLNESLLSLVAFLAVITITSLVLAASLNERERAEQALNRYTRNLEERVQERTAHLERRSVQLQVAAEVARDATSSTQALDELLTGAVELIRSRFGFYHAGIFLVDEAGEYAVLRAAASEAAPAMLAKGHRLEVGEKGIVGYVTATGQPRIALDVGVDAVYFKNPHLPNTHSEMALPLKVGGQVIGALDVQSEEEAAFDQEDIAVLSTLADQIAIAIQNVRSYERLIELSKVKSRFIANMSHELRTPLNAIINFSGFLINRKFGDLAQKQETLLQRILANGEHLLGLINDILDLSKIESGKMELVVGEVNLPSLLEGVRSTAVGLTDGKNVELVIDLPPGELPLILGDQTRIRQVLLNLLSNAAKFTNEGRITVQVFPPKDGFVTVSVSDTGIGIPVEEQERVFEEFHQVQGDLNREYQGTGLGLPICRRLIEMHGGTLTLHSTVGVGSTFTFTLPAVVTPAKAQADEPVSLTTQGRIVVVDDDSDSQTILKHALETVGWQVHSITDSREALEVIAHLQPQLVLLDIRMPYLDGWQLLNLLRAEPRTCKIPVVICSIVDPEQAQIGMVRGVQGWLVKPILREALVAEVATHVRPPATVLVVDDNPDSRTVVRSILEGSGWTVLEAADGEEGLAILTKTHPDLMILDLMMPTMDGFELLRQMDGMPEARTVPVVVLTAKELSEEERGWLTERTLGYFQKMSFPALDFPGILRSYLDKPANGGG